MFDVVSNETVSMPNSTFDRTAGSHSLAAAAHRGRYAAASGVRSVSVDAET
jgi:hypothetical protein